MKELLNQDSKWRSAQCEELVGAQAEVAVLFGRPSRAFYQAQEAKSRRRADPIIRIASRLSTREALAAEKEKAQHFE